MDEKQKKELFEKLEQIRVEKEAHCSFILRDLDVMCNQAGCTRSEAAIIFLYESVFSLSETVYNILGQMEHIAEIMDKRGR